MPFPIILTCSRNSSAPSLQQIAIHQMNDELERVCVTIPLGPVASQTKKNLTEDVARSDWKH